MPIEERVRLKEDSPTNKSKKVIKVVNKSESQASEVKVVRITSQGELLS